jgi:hypothetical protein
MASFFDVRITRQCKEAAGQRQGQWNEMRFFSTGLPETGIDFTDENGRLMAKVTGLSNAAESENRAKLVKKC